MNFCNLTCANFSALVQGALLRLRRLLNREPDEGKGLFAKLLPVWLSGMVYASLTSQVYTLFTKQGSTLDRRVGSEGLTVSAAALQCLVSFTFVTMLPIYDRAFVPVARSVTGHHAGVTTLQRIGAGIAMFCVAMVVAALVEGRRLRVARDAGVVDSAGRGGADEPVVGGASVRPDGPGGGVGRYRAGATRCLPTRSAASGSL